MALRLGTTLAIGRWLGGPRVPSRTGTNGDVMAKIEHADGKRRIVETPTEARQAEPGPSVLALLTISTIAAIFVLAIVWFVFFRT